MIFGMTTSTFTFVHVVLSLVGIGSGFVVQCVHTLTPKWSTQLAAFDVFLWDQCYAMEQSPRID